ncbi:MAG: hypothetical protein GY714_09615 [Desulfobacterales bacterium]|nr:hypothetical protein [Desulfobacterales bacterium]
MKNLNAKFKAIWENLDSKHKRYVTIGAVIMLFVIYYIFFTSSGDNKKRSYQVDKEQENNLLMDDDLLQKTLEKKITDNDLNHKNEITKMQDSMNEKLSKIREEMLNERKKDEQRIAQSEKPKRVNISTKPVVKAVSYEDNRTNKRKNYVGPPPLPNNIPNQYIGGIYSNPVTEKKKTDDEKKKDKKVVVLPISFVKAKLLTGIRASTGSNGKGEPSQLLFRIQDLAILPNQLRSNITGCFITAEGAGSLGKERVMVRIKTLACNNKKGHGIIDQDVMGYVQDSDGGEGLEGKVVSKMGSALSKKILADFIAGFGDGISVGTQVTEIATTGVQTIDIKDSLKDHSVAGFGKGIKRSTSDLKKIYVGLAEQSLPVIEVLPGKTVTIIFNKSVEIAIKKASYLN